RTRALRDRALRDERSAADGWRGTRDLAGCLEGPRRDHRGGRLRWSREQVSDLGARPFPKRARGGHRTGARAQEATGIPGGAESASSTGMTGGGECGDPAVAGGPARHIPVLARPAIELLNARDGGTFIDGTFGA